MDQRTIDQLEAYSDQLAACVKSLRGCRVRGLDSGETSGRDSSVDANANANVNANNNTNTNVDTTAIKASILATARGIKALLDEPHEFLQCLVTQVRQILPTPNALPQTKHLPIQPCDHGAKLTAGSFHPLEVQMEILACLKWITEFQILACIPPDASLPIEDLAALAGVPEVQLRRVIRLTASSGFLQETAPNYVSHTPMSDHFRARQSICDALAFIAEPMTPAALHMPSATRTASVAGSKDSLSTAYSLAFKGSRPFHAACQDQLKLERQWIAFLAHGAGLHSEDELVDTLSRLNWSRLGNACIIVEVGVHTTYLSRKLGKAFPNLHWVVQVNNTETLASIRDEEKTLHNQQVSEADNGVIGDTASLTVNFRGSGTAQPVVDAAVYILHLPASAELTRAELSRHLAPLRGGGGVLLILTTRVIPDPGSIADRSVETIARARDMCMTQLANESEMEMAELLQIVDSVADDAGKLVVANEVRSYNNGLILALAVTHRYHEPRRCFPVAYP